MGVYGDEWKMDAMPCNNEIMVRNKIMECKSGMTSDVMR